ncbi:MAG TPA: HisA/HisF-related TIM barrel protein [Gemmataceae bacterium]|nr:HisA/HisF-related TIM barrel protein [Gemmataceae bacterium]
MRIIPVLDVMGGVVVRGVGGRRHEYHPIVSRLTPACTPREVAAAFREHFGSSVLYLADLDAITGAQPALALYESLRREGFALWVDAGVRDAEGAQPIAAAGVEGIVIGLETVAGPGELARACGDLGSRVVFSLDLKGGEPLGNLSAWRRDAQGIAAQAVAAGVRRLLVLDLLRVGEGSGFGTEKLCRALASDHPGVELAAGGGVRGVADLRRLRDCGVGTALVASALHDGTLRRQDLDELRAPLDGR